MEPEGRSEQPQHVPISGAVGAFRIFGVPVRFHFTFLMLLVFLIFLGLSGRQSGAAMAIYVAALFGSVLLHELGHSLAARYYGVKTVEIVMFPIGGVARLDRALRAHEELWIALAGPAVNLVIAAAIFGYLYATGALVPAEQLLDATDENLLERIGIGNVILAVFNLLPAYPMDGGRVLRSLLARFRTENEATRIAAKTGRIFAGVMGLYGLLSMNFMLVFVALFVYLGASQEGAAAEGKALTEGIPVRAAMITDFRSLPHGATIRDAAELLIATSQQDFPVVFGDRVMGLLGRADLLKAIVSAGPEAYVSSVMNRNFLTLSPDEPLPEAMQKLAAGGSCALVIEDGKLAGLLTVENISEYLLLRKVGLAPLR
jgi:Zn-dependent protease/CBS domain-containing protein